MTTTFLSCPEERFGVPALIQHIPIGIENTGLVITLAGFR